METGRFALVSKSCLVMSRQIASAIFAPPVADGSISLT